MTPERLADLCRRRGYEVKVKRGEVMVHRCVFCSNPRYNLELNARKGVFSCWNCRSSGTLRTFMVRFLGRDDPDVDVDLDADDRTRTRPGVPDHLALQPGDLVEAWEVPSARKYLKRRGFGPADVRRYEVQVVRTRGHDLQGRLVFPMRTYFGREIAAYVARSYIGEQPKYKTITDQRPIPTVGFRMPGSEPHVIVEGPFDGVRVHQAGLNAVVLLGVDQGQLIDWARDIRADGGQVAVMLDGDAGEEARRIRGTLSPAVLDTVHLAELPDGLDPADFDPGVIRRLICPWEVEGGSERVSGTTSEAS